MVCAALVLAKPSFAAGVLAGGIVASANLYALIRLGKGLVRLAKGEEGNKLFFALKFAGKYGLGFASGRPGAAPCRPRPRRRR
jgi:hypothetical protein